MTVETEGLPVSDGLGNFARTTGGGDRYDLLRLLALGKALLFIFGQPELLKSLVIGALGGDERAAAQLAVVASKFPSIIQRV